MQLSREYRIDLAASSSAPAPEPSHAHAWPAYPSRTQDQSAARFSAVREASAHPPNPSASATTDTTHTSAASQAASPTPAPLVSTAGVLEGRQTAWQAMDGGAGVNSRMLNTTGPANAANPAGQGNSRGGASPAAGDPLYASAMDALQQVLASAQQQQHNNDPAALASHVAPLLASVLSDAGGAETPMMARPRKRAFVGVLVDQIGAEAAAQTVAKALGNVR